jgi:hypothetical protein
MNVMSEKDRRLLPEIDDLVSKMSREQLILIKGVGMGILMNDKLACSMDVDLEETNNASSSTN